MPSPEKGNRGFWPLRPDYRSIFLLSGAGIESENPSEVELTSLENRLQEPLGLTCK